MLVKSIEVPEVVATGVPSVGPPPAVCQVAAESPVAVNTCPVVGAVAEETLTVVVALLRALVSVDMPAVRDAAVPVALVATRADGVPNAGVTRFRLVTVPVALVNTKAEGVPRAGVVSTGDVNVLLVSVCVPVSVTRFVGVIIPDRVVMFYSGCVGHVTVKGNPFWAGMSRSAWRYGTYLSLMAWGVSAP
jgi:hypothetical protein